MGNVRWSDAVAIASGRCSRKSKLKKNRLKMHQKRLEDPLGELTPDPAARFKG